MNYSNQRVLVIAPHQDDETVGCGGIIQKYKQAGSEVRVEFATLVEGSYHKYDKVAESYITYTGMTRLSETLHALETLGLSGNDTVDSLYPNDWHHRLDTVAITDLLIPIEEAVEKYKPTVLLIPAKSNNQDHEALSRACESLIRPHFYDGDVLEYEVANESDFVPNFYVVLTESELECKLEAMRCYATQLSGGLHKVSVEGIRTKCEFRGRDIYTPYAEAFRIIRTTGRAHI